MAHFSRAVPLAQRATAFPRAHRSPDPSGASPATSRGRFERSSRDFEALAAYGRELDADVIALQEVDGAQAAQLVLPGYQFCFTSRRHPQNNGFAIRARHAVPVRPGLDAPWRQGRTAAWRHHGALPRHARRNASDERAPEVRLRTGRAGLSRQGVPRPRLAGARAGGLDRCSGCRPAALCGAGRFQP